MPLYVSLWFSTFLHTGNTFDHLLLSADHRGWNNEGGSPLCPFSNLRVQHKRDATCDTGHSRHRAVLLGPRDDGAQCAWGHGEVFWKTLTFRGIVQPCPAVRRALSSRESSSSTQRWQVLMKNHGSVARTGTQRGCVG